METNPDVWPLITFQAFAEKINYGQIPDVRPVYQRDGGVWDLDQEQLLIDSVLRGIDIPKIYLRKLENGAFNYEVIDGQQRIRALWRFLNDKYSLAEDNPEVIINQVPYIVADKPFSQLDEVVKTTKVYAYKLTIVVVSNATEDEVAELFFRLNNGTPLTAAEVRNAMPGEVTKFVRELAKHPFFKKCAFKNRGKAFDQIAAQMVCLELYAGNRDISDKMLTPMCEKFSAGLPSKVMCDIQDHLNTMDAIFPGKSKLLRRAAVINLYMLLSYLSKRTSLQGTHRAIGKWFDKTEPKRLKKPEYRLLTTRGANSRASLEGRFRWILYDFIDAFDEYKSGDLDPTLFLSEEQKAKILQNSGYKCQGTFCGGRKVRETGRWYPDYIVPWIEGGRTEVENARVLCPICNGKREVRLWSTSV